MHLIPIHLLHIMMCDLMTGYARILVDWNRRMNLKIMFSIYIFIVGRNKLTIKAAGTFDGGCMAGRG